MSAPGATEQQAPSTAPPSSTDPPSAAVPTPQVPFAPPHGPPPQGDQSGPAATEPPALPSIVTTGGNSAAASIPHGPFAPPSGSPPSPGVYSPPSPTHYPPTSPSEFRSSSPGYYPPASPIQYQPSSPGYYPPASPSQYRPSSPSHYPPPQGPGYGPPPGSYPYPYQPQGFALPQAPGQYPSGPAWPQAASAGYGLPTPQQPWTPDTQSRPGTDVGGFYVPPVIGPQYLGTEVIEGIIPSTTREYDPTADVNSIYKACHGFGTNDEALIKVLVSKTGKQMQILNPAYNNQRHKTLVALLEKETSGAYRDALFLLVKGPLEGDAYLLRRAEQLKVEDRLALLTEIIIRRDPAELELLKRFMMATEHVDFSDVVTKLISKLLLPSVRPIFDVALKTPEAEAPLSSEQIEADYTALKEGIVNGSKDSELIKIVLQRPHDHLYNLYTRYQRENFGQTVAEGIKRRFKDSKVVQDMLVYAVKAAEVEQHHGQFGNGIWRDMERIEESMAGSGANFEQLTWRIIRAHWNKPRFQSIIAAYAQSKAAKKETLLSRVTSETSRDYKELMRALVKSAHTN